MGQLNIPKGSKVYLDTAPIIYSVEKNPAYIDLTLQIWTLLDAGDIEVVTSELTLLETLVQPLRNSDDDLVKAYEELLTDSLVKSLPITIDIIRSSASLRANLNFKTPDALHAASALASGCDILIANDDIFRRTPGIQILILGDHVNPVDLK